MHFATFYFPVSLLTVLTLLLLILVATRFFVKKCNSKVCLVGKTAVVTGGSMGIGYEIVLALAQRGCRVIIADKVIKNDIKNKIIQETQNVNICMEYVDLGSLHSVRSLAAKLNERKEKLDILIHNAGIGQCEDAKTEDGLNLMMQVNYYSPFLLTHLLIDLLKKSPSARLIFCSSPIVSTFATYMMLGKQIRKRFGDYRLSKFCVLVASEIFAEKLRCHKITSNTFHPGVVNTGLHRQFVLNTILEYFSKYAGWIFFKTPEEGAQTAIYLACANEVQNITGNFFADLAPICKPKNLLNKRLCETIWDASEKLVKLKKEELL